MSQTILTNYSQGMTDLELCLFQDHTLEPVVVSLAESETNKGTYSGDAGDVLTGTWRAYIRRGTRMVAGNAVVTMPGPGGAAWLRSETPSAGGINLLAPAWSNVRRLITPGELHARTREARRQIIPVFADRQPVDLRNMQLQFTLKFPDGEIAIDDIEVSGTGHNQAEFIVPKTAHIAAGTFLYALRDLNDETGEENLTWAEGKYIVEEVPGPVS